MRDKCISKKCLSKKSLRFWHVLTNKNEVRTTDRTVVAFLVQSVVKLLNLPLNGSEPHSGARPFKLSPTDDFTADSPNAQRDPNGRIAQKRSWRGHLMGWGKSKFKSHPNFIYLSSLVRIFDLLESVRKRKILRKYFSVSKKRSSIVIQKVAVQKN